MKDKILSFIRSKTWKSVLLFLFFGSGLVQAHSYTAPKNMDFFGKRYALAFQNENESVALYEYTSNNEPVDNWSSLITLKYYKFKTNPMGFLTATKAGLEQRSSKPHYSLYQQGDHGYVLLIFEPSREHLHFEADIQKSFHIDNCDGTIELQYGIRKPIFKELTSEQYKQTLQEIYQQIKLDAEKVAQDTWVPSCNGKEKE